MSINEYEKNEEYIHISKTKIRTKEMQELLNNNHDLFNTNTEKDTLNQYVLTLKNMTIEEKEERFKNYIKKKRYEFENKDIKDIKDVEELNKKHIKYRNTFGDFYKIHFNEDFNTKIQEYKNIFKGNHPFEQFCNEIKNKSNKEQMNRLQQYINIRLNKSKNNIFKNSEIDQLYKENKEFLILNDVRCFLNRNKEKSNITTLFQNYIIKRRKILNDSK